MKENSSPTLVEGSMYARASSWEINSTTCTLISNLYHQGNRDSHQHTPPTPRTATLLSQTDNTKKNLHNYHLVKNMNRYLKKISVAAIYDQRIQGAKYMVIGYANKSFVELMDWIYVRYEQIIPRDLMRNQDEIQAK